MFYFVQSFLSKNLVSRASRFLGMILFTLCFTAFAPAKSWACACGCGIFDVGTGSTLPSGPGGIVSLEYDFMNQDTNWSGTSKAPAEDNEDKKIRTHFVTAGFQYLFNRQWGIRIDMPYWDRYFKTTDEDTGEITSSSHGAIGDIRIRGVYSGFSPDMSTGVTFGLKLPTGDWRDPHFDRDTEIGTGSTDILLGAYHRGMITTHSPFYWFIKGSIDQPVVTQEGYRPGSEFNVALGAYYTPPSTGKLKVTPMLQVIGSARLRDRGPAAAPSNSGYERVLLAPGLEVGMGSFKVYGDVEFAVYDRVNGNQLVASPLFKVILSRNF